MLGFKHYTGHGYDTLSPCRRKVRSRLFHQGLAILFLVLDGISPVAFAQEKDAPGSRDHPLISRYTGSYIIGYEHKAYDQHTLALGKPQRTADMSGWELASSQVVEGALTRILYVAPPERSSLEVLRNYEEALTEAGFEKLYECEPAECGSMLVNLIYPLGTRLTTSGQASEYALNFAKDPRFLVGRIPGPNGDIYVSVFVGIGNFDQFKQLVGRAITLLEVVETTTMDTGKVTVDAAVMAKGIDATGKIALYGIYFDSDRAEVKPDSKPTLDEIATLMRERPALNLYVVGHTDGTGALSHNLDLSQSRAEAVVAALVSNHGVGAERLVAKGVGPLAPVSTNASEDGRAQNRRVEIVAQ
jgi:OOP family OmpA-OmpF porin